MPPYRRGKKPRKPITTKKGPVSLSPAMKTAIKKVVAPAEEVKYIAKQWNNQVILSTLSTAGGANLYPMLPDVQQGVGANNRLGNTLNPKGIRTHFAMYFPDATLNTANVYIRLLCISSREVKDYNIVGSLAGGNLFLDGAGGAKDIPTGTTYADNLQSNQFLPVNKKAWIVHHDKIFHFAKNYGYTNDDATAGRDPTSFPPTYHRATFDTPHSGALKYDSNSDLQANNFAPFWCAYQWTDGPGITTTPIQVATRSDLYFVG